MGFKAFIPPSFSIFFLSFHKLWINFAVIAFKKIFSLLPFFFLLFAICSWIFHIISQYNLNKHLISCSFCLHSFVCFRLSSFRWLAVAVWIWSPFMFLSLLLVSFLIKFMDGIFNIEETDRNIHMIWIEIEVLGCNDGNLTLRWSEKYWLRFLMVMSLNAYKFGLFW